MPAKKPTQPAETAKQKAPARKSQPKISKADLDTAFARWLKGEQRGDIATDMKLGIGYAQLGKLFREHTGKTWPELEAMRKSPAKKASRKPKTAAKEEGATEFTKAPSKVKKGGKEESSDAPAARRRAA